MKGHSSSHPWYHTPAPKIDQATLGPLETEDHSRLLALKPVQETLESELVARLAPESAYLGSGATCSLIPGRLSCPTLVMWGVAGTCPISFGERQDFPHSTSWAESSTDDLLVSATEELEVIPVYARPGREHD